MPDFSKTLLRVRPTIVEACSRRDIYSPASPFGFCSGNGGEWVLGPRVFGIAAFKFFADFGVGTIPEAF